MQKLMITAGLTLGLLATPTIAAACDLDGMPGFHRYNPFAQVPGFPGLAPPMAPAMPDRDKDLLAEIKSDDQPKPAAAKPKPAPKKVKATAPQPPREYERDWGNGPISQEDLTTDI